MFGYKLCLKYMPNGLELRNNDINFLNSILYTFGKLRKLLENGFGKVDCGKLSFMISLGNGFQTHRRYTNPSFLQNSLLTFF